MSASAAVAEEKRRGAFSSRRVFILAAIGSAVGLGNIWRFPYVAYENGGGAFVIPYLVALLTAGIPFLLLDYGIGHKFRGSPPLSFARMRRGAEGIGWWQVGICAVIAIYYAAVLAWAVRYTFFSFNKSWGAKPGDFFIGEFLQTSEPGVSATPVAGVLIPLVVVWALVIGLLALGVQKGIGATAAVFIPILVLSFGALVVVALFLPGAGQGLEALFEPSWSALAEPSVWAAAFGQIFFSLSIGFGIMITYSSYVRRHTDMPGAGLVVGFSNSGFELLAGIGVFSALGFMAQDQGQEVGEVASSGVGLAFIAFPAIINEAPAGALIGVLFFASLVIAGLTSLISITEVVISAVRDKFELERVAATLVVALPMALVSVLFLGTTSGLHVLDIVDHFINQFGILLVAVVSMVVVVWGLKALPMLAAHLNDHTSVHIGLWWRALVGVVTPLALTYVLVDSFITDVQTPYGDPTAPFPTWMLAVFGWGSALAVIVVGFVLARLRWRDEATVDGPVEERTGPTSTQEGVQR
ncbi:Sodium:neurotransmitter symporter family protein [Nocardioides dokdonensis FR1436]|uniref:Transporter n=1 Tax=Nocardioides dokdonensis FR1436 TaxID=1300347 RepID=A0A1A9GPH5_9ACTN|nr:sodium-dependent transporter [Nocardioides dokdonensis]ANH40199.1 Sodium:neurotransmitter symporter family protein [Nocardioides dokdonensis FR1436]